MTYSDLNKMATASLIQFAGSFKSDNRDTSLSALLAALDKRAFETTGEDSIMLSNLALDLRCDFNVR